MHFGSYRRTQEILGSGSCKIVYKGINSSTGEAVAWAQVGIDDDTMDSDCYDELNLRRKRRALTVLAQMDQTQSELELLIAATQPGVLDRDRHCGACTRLQMHVLARECWYRIPDFEREIWKIVLYIKSDFRALGIPKTRPGIPGIKIISSC